MVTEIAGDREPAGQTAKAHEARDDTATRSREPKRIGDELRCRRCRPDDRRHSDPAGHDDTTRSADLSEPVHSDRRR